MGTKIWNIESVDKSDDFIEIIKEHYDIAIQSLSEQTNGELIGSVSTDFRVYDEYITTMLKLKIAYEDICPTQYIFMTTYIKYYIAKNDIEVSIEKIRGLIYPNIKTEEEFTTQFYSILLEESTGNIISNLLRIKEIK